MAADNTTFVKLKATENFKYKFAGEVHEFSKGEVFSVDTKLANTFINDVGKAEKTHTTYEVEDADTRLIKADSDQDVKKDGDEDGSGELGYRELQTLAKEHDISANQSKDELREALESEDLL